MAPERTGADGDGHQSAARGINRGRGGRDLHGGRKSRGGGESHMVSGIAGLKPGISSTSIASVRTVAGDGSFVRRDGGRFSMRTSERSTTGGSDWPMQTGGGTIKLKSPAGLKFSVRNAQQPASSSKERPSSGLAESSSPVHGGADQTRMKQLSAWKRRMEYGSVKSAEMVANVKASNERQKAGRAGDATHDGNVRAGKHDLSRPRSGRVGRRTVGDGGGVLNCAAARSEEIAELSNAVAYNLNVLSESTQRDSVLLVGVLAMLFICIY